MKSKIKSELCEKLLKSGLVEPYFAIEHSFTDGGGRNISNCIVATDNICPTITTRPDCLGVVVIEQEINSNDTEKSQKT